MEEQGGRDCGGGEIVGVGRERRLVDWEDREIRVFRVDNVVSTSL